MKKIKYNTLDIDIQQLIILAKKASQGAINRSDKVHVTFLGAAVETQSGKRYLGTFIENSTGSDGICAEKVALATALANGDSVITRMTIYCERKPANASPPRLPCGGCRQVLSDYIQYINGDIDIYSSSDSSDEVFFVKASELLPGVD